MGVKEVFDHHGQAFGAANVDELLKDYTEQSVIFTPEGAVRGLGAIRRFFEKAVADFPPGMRFEMKRLDIDGEVAYIVWSASTPRHEVPLGTDTFVVRDGKIAVQSFAAHMLPKKRTARRKPAGARKKRARR